jgi:predicted PilT family ATPase
VSTFTIPSEAVAHILGRGGSRVGKLKQEHGVRLDFEDLNAKETRVIVEGTEAACSAVQAEIESVVDEIVVFQFLLLIVCPSHA